MVLLFLIFRRNQAAGGTATKSISHSSSSSGEPLLYHQSTISPYLDETASSALLNRPPTSSAGSPQIHHDAGTAMSDTIDPFADGRGKYKRTAEARAKLSASLRASWTEERRKRQGKISKLFMTAKSQTEGFKEKMSKIRMGQTATKEARQKIAKKRIGKKHSEATKRKIRETILRNSAKKQTQPKSQNDK